MESLAAETPFAVATPPPPLSSFHSVELVEDPPAPAPPRLSATFTPVNREAYFEEALEGSSLLAGAIQDRVRVYLHWPPVDGGEVQVTLKVEKFRARPDQEELKASLPGAFSKNMAFQAGHHRSCFQYILSWCLCPQVENEAQYSSPQAQQTYHRHIIES